MKTQKSSQQTYGPSSSIGIMTFRESQAFTPKMSPEFVVGLSFVLIVVVLAFKFFI
ncbi:MAG TPA: preprotein translocase subunit Sec61beta [archaeon]|nr:preprotein translocase subunit Sec61beta [archaeon]